MSFPAVRLLIVEHDPMQQFAIEQLAQSIDYETDCVPSGEDAVRYFTRTQYASVLVDLLLPGMDGFECLAHLRRVERGGDHTPIIATSEHLYPNIRKQCISRGFDEFLAKPFAVEVLRRTLLQWSCRWCLPGSYIFREIEKHFSDGDGSGLGQWL